jgi:hypothetical protein
MREIEKNYVRCFNTPAGEFVLRHLRSVTIERYLGANATESELRGLEAQRALVHMIIKLVISV